jgi:hypothetical protein
VYIWEANVTPYRDDNPAEWYSILWRDGQPMAGFYALAQLMAPIPRGATALIGSTNTDMATAVFRSDGQITVAIVNDVDGDDREITLTVRNVRVADNPGKSV